MNGAGLLVLGIRITVSGLFLYSGWMKVIDLETFAAAIQGYRILPELFTFPATAMIPWLEIWCAVALWIAPPFRRAAWIWISLMLVVFTLAKISVLQRGIATTCGCSGSEDLMTWKDVGINFIWLILSIAGWCRDKRG